MRPARDYELPEYPTCNYMFSYLETRSRDMFPQIFRRYKFVIFIMKVNERLPLVITHFMPLVFFYIL